MQALWSSGSGSRLRWLLRAKLPASAAANLQLRATQAESVIVRAQPLAAASVAEDMGEECVTVAVREGGLVEVSAPPLVDLDISLDKADRSVAASGEANVVVAGKIEGDARVRLVPDSADIALAALLGPAPGSNAAVEIDDSVFDPRTWPKAEAGIRRPPAMAAGAAARQSEWEVASVALAQRPTRVAAEKLRGNWVELVAVASGGGDSSVNVRTLAEAATTRLAAVGGGGTQLAAAKVLADAAVLVAVRTAAPLTTRQSSAAPLVHVGALYSRTARLEAHAAASAAAPASVIIEQLHGALRARLSGAGLRLSGVTGSVRALLLGAAADVHIDSARGESVLIAEDPSSALRVTVLANGGTLALDLTVFGGGGSGGAPRISVVVPSHLAEWRPKEVSRCENNTERLTGTLLLQQASAADTGDGESCVSGAVAAAGSGKIRNAPGAVVDGFYSESGASGTSASLVCVVGSGSAGKSPLLTATPADPAIVVQVVSWAEHVTANAKSRKAMTPQ